jgi:hypothetical protein
MEAEIGLKCILLRNVKDCWQHQKLRGNHGTVCVSSLQREHGPVNMVISEFYMPEL